MFNIAIVTLRLTFFPKDADVFAELEKDPLIKARFEEEAASELQQSWTRGKGTRDDEIQALLDRPRILEEGNSTWDIMTKVRTSDEDLPSSERVGERERRTSITHTGYDEEIEQRFGAVIRKPFKRRSTSESA